MRPSPVQISIESPPLLTSNPSAVIPPPLSHTPPAIITAHVPNDNNEVNPSVIEAIDAEIETIDNELNRDFDNRTPPRCPFFASGNFLAVQFELFQKFCHSN